MRHWNPGDSVLLTGCEVWYDLPAGAIGTVVRVPSDYVTEVEFSHVVIPGEAGTFTITAPIWNGILQKVTPS
jgi:hypothetical protein